ncbi:MAG: AAA family ATPase [Candidatus Diapherotrites archaeon]|nr:AAA family ATPase [Candidatus Diapherotrites archaeon]
MKDNLFAKQGVKVNELFKNERVLYPEFIPERLPFRDVQIDELVFAFKPLTEGRKARNVFVFGNTGTGKTATVKYVLKELQEYSDRPKALVLNCFEKNSRHSVLVELANFLGNAVPERGLSTAEVHAEVLQSLKNCGFLPIVVLDEFDQLLNNGGEDLLYDLLRAPEQGLKTIPVILISNNQDLLAMLDARVKSSLQAVSLKFDQYSPVQLKEILKQRAEFAFREGTLEKEVINVASAHASKLGGDARIAIESLLNAGRIAERENSAKVSLAHLKKAFETIELSTGRKKLSTLSEDEKSLLKIISKNPGGIDSGELFLQFSKTGSKVSDRRFREIVSLLEKNKVISAQQATKGKGKTRIFRLGVKKESLKL